MFQFFAGEAHRSDVIYLDRHWSLWVIKMSVFLTGVAFFAFSNADTISASAADAMKFLRTVQRMWIVTFLGVFLRFFIVSINEKNTI